MKNFETLENRTFLSNSVNWNKDVVHLSPGVTYTLNKPVMPRSGQKIIGDKSGKNPPILKLKQKGRSVVVINPNIHHVEIHGVRFDGYKNMPSVRVSGNSNTFSHISVTKSTGSAFIIENAEGILIKDCQQTNITQRGFIYGNRFWNLTIRNVSTCGNLYENEFRFHGFNGLGIFNCRIDASNPVLGSVNKENAVRVHDGKRAYINGLTVSGNVYFGVMDKNNGGLDSLKRGDIAEFKRKMLLTSNIIAENIRIYGNLTLGTGLKFKINNLGMISWLRGGCIAVNPKYGPFKNGLGLYRSPAKGIVNGLTAKFTNSPPANRSLGGLIKYFDKGVKINSTGKLISYTKDVDFIETYFNKIEYKK